MAKKRKNTKKRKAPRRNPRRRIGGRAVARARSTFAGLNIKSALKDIPATQFGMFATKWFAKRFGPEALEGDPGTWNWSSYLKGSIGAVAAGFVAQMVKPGTGQKVLAGGLNLIAYKLIQNQFIAGNAWATEQFGADDEYMEGADGGYLPGDVEDDASGQSYLLGEDRQWHALPSEGSGMGDVLEPVGRLGGVREPLVPVGPLGATTYDDIYRKALLDS
jgi:hypothetical protein